MALEDKPRKISERSTVVKAKEQVSCLLGDEVAILNLRNGVYYGLNLVGAQVWELICQPRAVREIRDALVEEFEVEPDHCEKDLVVLLEEMAAEELIEVINETSE